MLLKCRYLSQFSMNDLSKNASSISKAVDQCPFMTHVKRQISTTTTAFHASKEETKNLSQSINEHIHQKQQQQQIACTNNINCPFFNNSSLDMNKLIKKRNLDNENESNGEVMFSNSDKKREYKTATKRKLINLQTENNVSSNKENINNDLFNYEKFFSNQIEAKKKDGSYRYFKKVVRHAQSFPQVQEYNKNSNEVRDITIWCSNDYLGLGRHPYVQARVCEAVQKYGAGSGGTRNISGSTPLHDQLEYELARLHQKEASLLFTSCYVANDTTLYTMAKMLPKCHILSDAGNHASMIQGIRNSGIPKHIFRHNDYDHLEELLRKLPSDVPKIVAFESVHSMDGSICDVKRMCDIAHKYGCINYIDEVHAVGLYGQNGGGIGERDNVLECMDIITGNFFFNFTSCCT
jgi:5-aminolevulinate synthase